MADWLSQGFEAAEEEAAKSSNFAMDFFMKPDETAIIRILNEEPENVKQHFIKEAKTAETCSVQDCILCEVGIQRSNKHVFNVLDKRTWEDKEGKDRTNEVKVWSVGIRLLRQLKRKRDKFGPLTSFDLEVTRLGEGTSTVYDLDVINDVDEDPGVEEEDMYDLKVVLAPKTRSELKALLSGEDKDEGFKEVKEDDDEDSVPW